MAVFRGLTTLRHFSLWPYCLLCYVTKGYEFSHLNQVLSTFECFDRLFHFWQVGGDASSSSSGTGIAGIELSASSSRLDGWFRIVSKCSAHLFKIVDGSVSSVEPSALLTSALYYKVQHHRAAAHRFDSVLYRIRTGCRSLLHFVVHMFGQSIVSLSCCADELEPLHGQRCSVHTWTCNFCR